MEMASSTASSHHHHPLGPFGKLPTDLLTKVCKNLPMCDIVTLSALDKRLEMLVETIIYKEIKGIRVEVDEKSSLVYFLHKQGHTTHLNLEHVDWQHVVKFGHCIETIELNIHPDKSTCQLFHVLKRAQFRLKTLKIKLADVSETNAQKLNRLHQRCIALVSQHRSTLAHLEASTSDEQHVLGVVETSSMRLVYNQAKEPKASEQIKQSTNHYFVYNLFHAMLEYRSINHVTLEIDNKFDANLALQKAFQIAIPHSKRRNLETLTIDFGASLKAVTEEDMKRVLLRHVDEFHFTTPNLQHFHCNLPHDRIDLSPEFLAQLNEPVRKSRKSSTSRPYNSSISNRVVKCK